MKRKYETIEELAEHRKELDKEYDSGLPDYLIDFFDEAEQKLKRDAYFEEKKRLKYSSTSEEKKEYFDNKDKEFWDKNEFEVIKKQKRVGKHLEAVYEESERNEQRVDDEKDLSEDEVKILVAMCEKDLYLFAIRYFSHYLKKPSSSFHKYLYSYLTENTNKRKRHSRGFKHAVAAPRSNSKSTIMSTIFPLWCIAYNKKKFIVIVSDTVGQAIDFLSDIKREIDHNALLQRDFPHIIGKGPTWKQDEIITSNGTKLLALGTGSKIRGRKFGVYRPDLICGDDLENSEMVRSEVERTAIRYDWLNKDLLHVHGEKGTFTDILIVGTILGKEALLPALLDPTEYPDWSSKKFKAVLKFSNSGLWDDWEEVYKNRFDEERINTARVFFEEHKEEMLEGTEVLWPEGDPYYDLMVEKISDPSAFESEKQNNPIDSFKILVPLKKLRMENFNQDWIHKILKNRNNPTYGALDPSLGKKNKKGDYSCIVTLIQDIKTGYILVLSMNLRRRSVESQIKAILQFHEEYRYKLFAVETNAFQLVVADTLRKYSRESGILVPVKDIIVSTDKKMRLEKHIPILTDGTVVFNKQKFDKEIMYAKSIEQLTTFIGDGKDKHDDAVDAISMCLDLITAKKFVRRTKQNR